MRLGRIEKHLHKNVLAVGLSQGFIEPLEATAIGVIQYTVQLFISCVINARENKLESKVSEDDYNNKINNLFDEIKDYITAHYRLNTRTDSQYWIDNRNNPSNSEELQRILSGWDDPTVDFPKLLTELDREKSYPASSWYCMLAGKGRFPSELKPPTDSLKVAPYKDVDNYCYMQSTNFKAHKQQLLDTYPAWPDPERFTMKGES